MPCYTDLNINIKRETLIKNYSYCPRSYSSLHLALLLYSTFNLHLMISLVILSPCVHNLLFIKLKYNIHMSVHSCNLLMSSYILVQLQAESYILVSSAKTLQQHWTHSSRSLIKILNSISPSTLPCWMPLNTSAFIDQSFTLWLLCGMKSSIQLYTFPVIA